MKIMVVAGTNYAKRDLDTLPSLPHMYRVYVVLQFSPRFKFYFLLFLEMAMNANEFETKKKYNLNQR